VGKGFYSMKVRKAKNRKMKNIRTFGLVRKMMLWVFVCYVMILIFITLQISVFGSCLWFPDTCGLSSFYLIKMVFIFNAMT